MNIGIVVIATNAYFILGLKFIKRFLHFYKGSNNIIFFFFSDTDPTDYVPSTMNIKYINEVHNNWVEGTNSKFKNIISLENEDIDYIYYFDADTNVYKHFTDEWFIGDIVGGEHFGNRTWMKDNKPYDRNPKSKAYIPEDTTLPQMYYYGAFFGGTKYNVINLSKLMFSWQQEDKKIPHEPIFNDESYLNAYFHYNPPHTITNENFNFLVSDKGGIGETRNTKLDIESIKSQFLELKNTLNINIYNNKVITYDN